tara:strand:- start:418 stop:813 length:396 start_codon:yes stop_codon:yes gene_type:complete
MLTLITVSIGLFLIILTGWTVTSYFLKKNSQKFIKEELTNLFDICKKLFVSLKNLIGILASNSVSSEEREGNSVDETVLTEDEQLLNLVQPVTEIETQSLEVAHKEDYDAALSSFSPEVVEVINDEEEKVA